MSWVSTELYYRLINSQFNAKRGRQSSAPLVIASVDFQPIVDAQVRGDWDATAKILAEKARGLERAGASAFLIASNTMHLVLKQVRASVGIPALDIFDATADEARRQGKRRLGLLGTRYTMSHAFFRDEYAARGIDIITPDVQDAKRVNEIIFRELICDVVRPESKIVYDEVVRRLAVRGAEGVIMGCTEIGLLLDAATAEIPLFDTSRLHAAQAVSWLCD